MKSRNKNRNDSPAKKTPKMSFSDEETVAYSHQAYFLHYLHKLEPEVETTLQELLPSYKILFDKHETVDREAVSQPLGFPEFFRKHFTVSSWQDINAEQGLGDSARRYLAEHNDLLRTVLRHKSLRWKAVEGRVKEVLDHSETSEELRKNPYLEVELQRMLYETVFKEDDYLERANELENLLLRFLSQFRLLFFEKLIKRFHLEKDWLCLSAFLAIQEGKLKLEMPCNYTIHSYPTEVLQEFNGDEYISSIVSFFPRGLPLHESFQFSKPFSIYDNTKEYEKQALAAYQKHLRTYVEKMQQTLRSHGYKLKRKDYDYSRVEWLVRWTVQGWTVSQILSQYNVGESTVWKAFRTFEKYDLPVRKKRANGSQPEVFRAIKGT